MSGDLNLNTQAAASAFMGGRLETAEGSSVKQSGSFDGQTVTVSADVDPTTKDDEVMSNVKSEQETKKKQAKKAEKDTRKGLNSAVGEANQVKSTEGAAEQNADVRRKQKEIAQRLEKQSQERVEYNASDRSSKLFPESEEVYKQAFKALNELPANASPQTFLQNAFELFADVAEQHNAFQVAKQSWEDELALLQGGQIADTQNPGHYRSVQGQLKEVNDRLSALSKDPSESSAQEKEDLQVERDVISARIAELEVKLATLNKASGRLMDTQGARITDSYRLAPELRKHAGTSPKAQLLDTPKDLNAIILDKILPFGKDLEKIFNSVSNEFFNDPANGSDTHSQVERFTANLWLVETTLTNELNNLQSINQYGDSKDIAKAIMDSVQAMREMGSVFASNESMLQNMQKAQLVS
ncbi:MAG: hypothetical protein LBH52_01965 [Puniceicoccales bacterium]|jgi:hypothetical protein|nr:hypothetical protein [Puniceicoccales bacterium]